MLTKTNIPVDDSVGFGAGLAFMQLVCAPKHLNFPRSVARAMWHMIASSDDPEARGFRFALDALLVAAKHETDRTKLLDKFDQFCLHWITPGLLRSAVEELKQRGQIRPALARDLHLRINRYGGMYDEPWHYLKAQKEPHDAA